MPIVIADIAEIIQLTIIFLLNLDHSEVKGSILQEQSHLYQTIWESFLVFFCTYSNKWYLMGIKFRMDKSSRFSRLFAKTAKLNPREMYKNRLDHEILST